MLVDMCRSHQNVYLPTRGLSVILCHQRLSFVGTRYYTPVSEEQSKIYVFPVQKDGRVYRMRCRMRYICSVPSVPRHGMVWFGVQLLLLLLLLLLFVVVRVSLPEARTGQGRCSWSADEVELLLTNGNNIRLT